MLIAAEVLQWRQGSGPMHLSLWKPLESLTYKEYIQDFEVLQLREQGLLLVVMQQYSEVPRLLEQGAIGDISVWAVLPLELM